VHLDRTDAAGVVVISSGLAGLGTAIAVGAAIGTAAATAGPLGIAGAVAVSLGWAGAGSWVTMRAIWRRIARSWTPRATALGVELVGVAQRALDAERKDNE
jgi:hypothetical protein